VQRRVDPGRRGAAALVVAALLAAVVAGGFVLRGRPQEVVVPQVVATGEPLPGAAAAPTTPATDVVVAVAGKVVRPGLVRLPAGSRVDDAVRAAGGVVDGVDPGLLNLARRLVDGEQVLVGVDPPPGAAPAPGSSAAGGPVDLNTATVADLDALPGIGPVLAQRIVDWRAEHGRFASVEQLREVTGIGESKYADLAAEVAVG
jgi:competence protein ComEA